MPDRSYPVKSYFWSFWSWTRLLGLGKFGEKSFLVFPWAFSIDKRARFTKIELLVLFLSWKVHGCFPCLIAGGDSNGEDLRYFYLHHEIIKTVDSVTWDEEFSDPLSIGYEKFLQYTISELVRMMNDFFLSGIYEVVKRNFWDNHSNELFRNVGENPLKSAVILRYFWYTSQVIKLFTRLSKSYLPFLHERNLVFFFVHKAWNFFRCKYDIINVICKNLIQLGRLGIFQRP